MKVGIFTVLFSGRPLEETLDYVKQAGCTAVELGTGGFPGDAHCKPSELLGDRNALKTFRDAISSRGLEISALSCHGNPLHPQAEIAQAHDAIFRETVKLAAELGVQNVITFSGCPGDTEGSKYPNWVSCPWPPEFGQLLE